MYDDITAVTVEVTEFMMERQRELFYTIEVLKRRAVGSRDAV